MLHTRADCMDPGICPQHCQTDEEWYGDDPKFIGRHKIKTEMTIIRPTSRFVEWQQHCWLVALLERVVGWLR